MPTAVKTRELATDHECVFQYISLGSKCPRMARTRVRKFLLDWPLCEMCIHETYLSQTSLSHGGRVIIFCRCVRIKLLMFPTVPVLVRAKNRIQRKMKKEFCFAGAKRSLSTQTWEHFNNWGCGIYLYPVSPVKFLCLPINCEVMWAGIMIFLCSLRTTFKYSAHTIQYMRRCLENVLA